MSIFRKCVESDGKILLNYYLQSNHKIIYEIKKLMSNIRYPISDLRSKHIFGRCHSYFIPCILYNTLHTSGISDPAQCGGYSSYNIYYFTEGVLCGMYLVFEDLCGSCRQCSELSGWPAVVKEIKKGRYDEAAIKIKKLFFERSELYCDINDAELRSQLTSYMPLSEIDNKKKVYITSHSIFYMKYHNIPNEIVSLIIRNV